MILAAAPSVLEVHAAWVLVVTFAISLAYELWRATAKAGSTEHDSMHNFVTKVLALYVLASIVIGLLFAGVPGAAWVGLVFSVVFILVSIFYYNPVYMCARDTSLIAWAEDLTYTGLLFVAAFLLFYEVAGLSLG